MKAGLDQDATGLARRGPLSCALLGAGFQTANHGVGALASGTLAALMSADPGAQVAFLDYGREPLVSCGRVGGRTIRVPLINLRFSKKIWQTNHVVRLLMTALLIRFLPSSTLRNAALRRNAWLRRLSDIPIHLSIAGGDSFSDIYGLRRLLYVVLPQLLVLALGKPLVLMPQTYGPFQSMPARWLARRILGRAALIYSRDEEGVGAVHRLLGRKREGVHFAYDMGFALEPHPPDAATCERLAGWRQRGPLLGLNVSGLLYRGGYTGRNMFGLKADYATLIHALAGELMDRYGVQILLIPHVLGGGAKGEGDDAACVLVQEHLGARYADRLHRLDGPFDHHETKYIIGQCDFLIGSRMHACIAALSQCVPALGLAYSRKFGGVLSSVEGGSRVVDLREQDVEQVMAAAVSAWAHRDQLRWELEKNIPAVRSSVAGFFRTSAFESLWGGDA